VLFVLRELAGAWLRRDKRFGEELVATALVLWSAFLVVVFVWIAATALEKQHDAFNIGVAALFIFLAAFEIVKGGGMLFFFFVTRREELRD
jgi:hypothetical protein